MMLFLFNVCVCLMQLYCVLFPDKFLINVYLTITLPIDKFTHGYSFVNKIELQSGGGF